MRVTGKITIKDYPKVKINYKKFAPETMHMMLKTIDDNVHKMRNHIIKSMKGTSRANWFYWRQKGKQKHYPSAPGSFPAVDSGELWKNILIETKRTTVEIGPTAKYGKFLEFGTKKMKKRPFLEPTLNKLLPEMAHDIQTLLRNRYK